LFQAIINGASLAGSRTPTEAVLGREGARPAGMRFIPTLFRAGGGERQEDNESQTSPLAFDGAAAGKFREEPLTRCSPLSSAFLASYLAWLAFMWGLPQWSYTLNDSMMMFNHRWQSYTSGPNNYLCMTPTEEMTCSDGSNFADLPIVKWRMAVSNRTNVGCGCGQGVIGEGSCGQDGGHHYTLSSYIATTPATGAFAGLVAPAIATMWWVMARFYELTRPSKPPHWLCVIHHFSLLAFQIVFAMFAFGTDCIYLPLHLWTSVAFQACMWLYNMIYIVLSCLYGPRHSNVIWIVLSGAAISLGANFLMKVWETFQIDSGLSTKVYVMQHSFFIWECLMLTGCFSVGPLLMVLGEVEVPSMPRRARGDAEAVGAGAGGAQAERLEDQPILSGSSPAPAC